jgi:aspartyl-tRNA(Asn)/glutamyl-tRNA(Gln) amidotransferase subunit B
MSAYEAVIGADGFEAVIGLEVHCQLATESKIFCACPARVDGSVAELAPNSNVCPVCAGHPGSLPALNRKVVEYAIRAGLATSCRIRDASVFARKNYFYPDLPKGYQISQYDQPICEHGHLDIETSAGPKRVPITRIHIEEDAGKNTHHSGYSLVNLNRAGVPLVEIVSGPDMRSAEEAGAYLRALHAVVTYLGICDGNMQEGNFRCDANVSVRPRGQAELGTRVEIKNVNSFRFIEKAIDYEVARQVELVKAGRRVTQETRGYDSARAQTYSMRSKEEAQDYRYFPDPDLIPVRADAAWVEEIRSALPELPAAKRARFIRDLGLTPDDAAVITASQELALFLEEAVRLSGLAPRETGKPAANLLATEVTRLLNEEGIPLARARLTPAHVGALVRLAQQGHLSSTGVKQALAEAWRTGDAVDAIVERGGLRQVSDASALEPVVDRILAAHPAQVAEFRAGKEKLLGFFVGQMMKETGGKANPGLLQDLVRRKLTGG